MGIFVNHALDEALLKSSKKIKNISHKERSLLSENRLLIHLLSKYAAKSKTKYYKLSGPTIELIKASWSPTQVLLIFAAIR
jgi:hypothetical protein